MTTSENTAPSEVFRALHQGPDPLLLANAWDEGTAKALAFLGFKAIATTSAGFAATRGRHDGNVSREEAIAHGRDLVAAVDVPVSADLENGFADDPAQTAETVRLAIEAGLAGCSIEDWTAERAELYGIEQAKARIEAAAEAAHRGPRTLVLTARAENHIRGNPDLADTITRLQAYQEAGADVLYAPGLTDAEDIARVVAEVDLPVNVLAMPGVPRVPKLAELGVRRVSVGSAFSLVAYGALAQAAQEWLGEGTYHFFSTAAQAAAVRGAFDT